MVMGGDHLYAFCGPHNEIWFAISLLKVCVEEEKFMTQETFQQAMLEVPKLVKESNFFAENMPRYK
jgi:hypothetical protein